MRPLEGLFVLDFSTLLPGPLATLLLAEAGAEVVKIEPPRGEEMRGRATKWGHDSVGFALLNRGKLTGAQAAPLVRNLARWGGAGRPCNEAIRHLDPPRISQTGTRHRRTGRDRSRLPRSPNSQQRPARRRPRHPRPRAGRSARTISSVRRPTKIVLGTSSGNTCPRPV